MDFNYNRYELTNGAIRKPQKAEIKEEQKEEPQRGAVAPEAKPSTPVEDMTGSEALASINRAMVNNKTKSNSVTEVKEPLRSDDGEAIWNRYLNYKACFTQTIDNYLQGNYTGGLDEEHCYIFILSLYNRLLQDLQALQDLNYTPQVDDFSYENEYNFLNTRLNEAFEYHVDQGSGSNPGQNPPNMEEVQQLIDQFREIANFRKNSPLFSINLHTEMIRLARAIGDALIETDPEEAQNWYHTAEELEDELINGIHGGRGGDDGSTPVEDKDSINSEIKEASYFRGEVPETAKGDDDTEIKANEADKVAINRSGEDYNSVLNEARNLNKELWGDITTLMERYSIEQPEEPFSGIGDNPDPNDERFQVLSKLSDKITDEERDNIRVKVFKLVDLISQAHELNNLEYGEEDILKHPLTYGIIECIINR